LEKLLSRRCHHGSGILQRSRALPRHVVVETEKDLPSFFACLLIVSATTVDVTPFVRYFLQSLVKLCAVALLSFDIREVGQRWFGGITRLGGAAAGYADAVPIALRPFV
jgi:hypothetical protein